MLIVYEPIFEAPKEGKDGQPHFFAGTSGMGIMLSLRTSDFEVRYKDGKAEVSLARHLTPDECKALAKALLDTTEANERMHAQWVQANEALNAEETDPTYPGGGLRGRMG